MEIQHLFSLMCHLGRTCASLIVTLVISSRLRNFVGAFFMILRSVKFTRSPTWGALSKVFLVLRELITL